MDIRQLRYFVAIADSGSITKAARHLNISQPPLSKQLRLLEEELGTTLFHRNSRSISLTSEGIILYKRAKVILKEYYETCQEFENLKNGIHGSINIGTITSSALMLLPSILEKYQSLRPDINFQIYEASSDQVLQLVENETVDIGIIREPFDLEKYDHFLIKNPNLPGAFQDQDVFVAVGSPKWLSSSTNHISFSELGDKPLIIHRFYESLIRHNLEEQQLTSRILCTGGNLVTSLVWAIEELGIALVPRSSAAFLKQLKGGESMIVKSLTEPALISNTALVWKHDCISTAAFQFVQYIRDSQKMDV